jgi:hypothetical protein
MASTTTNRWVISNEATTKGVVSQTRFEVLPVAQHNATLIHETLQNSELRGSPSLVGRGIANPMSERTRGFEILIKRRNSHSPRQFYYNTLNQLLQPSRMAAATLQPYSFRRKLLSKSASDITLLSFDKLSSSIEILLLNLS